MRQIIGVGSSRILVAALLGLPTLRIGLTTPWPAALRSHPLSRPTHLTAPPSRRAGWPAR